MRIKKNAENSRASRPSAKAPSRGGTLGSRKRPPDEARRSILAAADRLFYEHGVVSVGVDAVAEAAGVTKRTLYYHFASKEDLVAAYLEARDEATLEALRSTPGRGGSRPGDRILGIFDYVERWCETLAYRGCPFNNAVAEQASSPKVTAIARRHKTTMAAWFAERAREGRARDAEAAGARLLVLLDGALNGAAVFGSSAAAATASAMAEALVEAEDIERSPAPRRRGP